MYNIDKTKIIPAVADISELKEAVTLESDKVFLTKSNMLSISKIVKFVHENNKKLYVHIDMMEGLGKDLTAVKFLAKLGVDGLISTRSNMITYARECGMSSIQRFFILDGQSSVIAYETIKKTKPDMVEIMPGILGKVISEFAEKLYTPVISSGLLTSLDEVDSILKAGATAVSSGSYELWEYAKIN